jgi:hypothetical protein
MTVRKSLELNADANFSDALFSQHRVLIQQLNAIKLCDQRRCFACSATILVTLLPRFARHAVVTL